MDKLCVMNYKIIGTKISIKNNIVTIQDSWSFQGIQRWFNSDERDQLYQLSLPIFYFRGIVLGFITFKHLTIQQDMLNYFNALLIKGLKKIRITYENEKKAGSMVKNCLDDFIKTLSVIYTEEDYMKEIYQTSKPTLFAIYNEYTKKWQLNDIRMIYELFNLIETKENPNIQNKLADCVNDFINAKDLELDFIRPD